MPVSHLFEETPYFTDIAGLNELIGNRVKQHMPGIEIRFDEPDPDNPAGWNWWPI